MSRPPLRLADGTFIYKDGHIEPPDEVVEETVVEVNTKSDPSSLVITAKKKLRDLPETTRTMNGIAAVLAYSLFGLDDDEIALAIGTTMDRVSALKELPSFVVMRNEVISNVLSAESGDVRELFVKHSRSAVKTVVDGMNAPRMSDRLRAAGDILDRSGFRPADVVEHRHKLEGGLTIEIVRKDTSAPVINIEMEDI